MENKKYFLSLLIIVLVLFLGVGYAVVSSVYIKTGGTASVSDYELNVEITNAVASTNIADKTVDFSHVLSNKNLTSNFTLNGMTLGEVVTITYTVTNNEKDVDALLSLANGVTLSNSNTDYFYVDYEITDSKTHLKDNDNTMEVVVTVELFKTPVLETGGSTTVGLTLTASPSDTSEDVIVAYSYDGVELPAFPDYDTEKYQYAMIRKSSDNTYSVLFSDKRFRAEDELYYVSIHCPSGLTNWLSYKYDESSNSWVFVFEDAQYTFYSHIDEDNEIIWSNQDITWVTTNKLYFAGSEPIPIYE